MEDKLVYIGKIVTLEEIPGADFIKSATVVCGSGGKWKGIVKKEDFQINSLCIVYLPDSIILPSQEMSFMKKHKWRVKICRFKGAPSEVLIAKTDLLDLNNDFVGRDVTQLFGVKKFFKPVPANLACEAKGPFPNFIPKTDEPNYQREDSGVNELVSKPYYITEKCDGSSTTAYKYKGEFGVCSRNWELQRKESNGYWKVAIKYKLEELLPEGIALQWETCGPGIQSNPMGLQQIEGFAFNAYNIHKHEFLDYPSLVQLCEKLSFPMVLTLAAGGDFDLSNAIKHSEGKYKNGNPREGVVCRSYGNKESGKPISFKIINLSYEN